MLDRLRTVIARSTVGYLNRPVSLVVAAWLWLAAEADDTEVKRRCLNAILELDPENEPASLALLVLDHKRPDSWSTAHGRLLPPFVDPTISARPGEDDYQG